MQHGPGGILYPGILNPICLDRIVHISCASDLLSLVELRELARQLQLRRGPPNLPLSLLLTETWDAAKIACSNEVSVYCVTDSVYFRSHHVPKRHGNLILQRLIGPPPPTVRKIVAHPETKNVRKGRAT